MLMQIYMKVNDNMIKLMAEELIHMPMELNMKVNGEKIDSTGWEWKRGQMVRDIRESINLVKSMEKVCCYLLMEALMMASLCRMIFKELELIVGLMVENI